MEVLTTLLDWYQSLDQKEKIFYMLALFAWIFLLYKLARSEDVDESGRVVVTYHSPLTWLKRFNNQVAENRAGYSDKQRSFLSKMWAGGRFFSSIPPFILSLILFLMAYFTYGEENFWYVFIAAMVSVLIFISQFRSAWSNENPFKED